MSVYGGPEVVNSGLVLCLDAANPKSYPGSGTTWTDMSGLGNNGTLTNGPTYDANNAGSIVFSSAGSNYVDCSNSSIFNFTNTTVSCWFKKSYTALYKGLVDKGRDDYGAWSLNVDENGNTITFKARISGVNRFVSASSPYTNNSWTNAVGVYNGTNLIVYQNGILSNSAAYSGSIGTNLVAVRVGAANDGLYCGGNISNVQIYNRALSAAEVQQNFNALRGRYGI